MHLKKSKFCILSFGDSILEKPLIYIYVPEPIKAENGFCPMPSCAAFNIGSCISLYILCSALKPPGKL
jgi:hypothetical protein